MKNDNAYGFSFNDVSEEDIIKGAMQSGVAIFLHGHSSEGKSVYNQSTGEMIRSLVEEGITKDFVNLCKIKNVTVVRDFVKKWD